MGGGLIERGHQLVHLGVELDDHRGEVVDVAQMQPEHQAMMVIEAALQRQAQLGNLGAHPSPGHLRQHVDVGLAGDQRVEHLPGGLAHHVGDHRVQLDVRVFQQLLDSLDLTGAFLGQLRAIAGQVPQPGHLLGRHERTAQQPALQQLREPRPRHRHRSCGPAGSSRAAR